MIQYDEEDGSKTSVEMEAARTTEGTFPPQYFNSECSYTAGGQSVQKERKLRRPHYYVP